MNFFILEINNDKPNKLVGPGTYEEALILFKERLKENDIPYEDGMEMYTDRVNQCYQIYILSADSF